MSNAYSHNLPCFPNRQKFIMNSTADLSAANLKNKQTPTSIHIPEQILKQMRLNKNFANVYTPYHEFQQDSDDDLASKKQRRKKRFQNLLDLAHGSGNYQKPAQVDLHQQNSALANQKPHKNQTKQPSHITTQRNLFESDSVNYGEGFSPQRDLRKSKLDNTIESAVMRQKSEQINPIPKKSRITAENSDSAFRNNIKNGGTNISHKTGKQLIEKPGTMIDPINNQSEKRAQGIDKQRAKGHLVRRAAKIQGRDQGKGSWNQWQVQGGDAARNEQFNVSKSNEKVKSKMKHDRHPQPFSGASGGQLQQSQQLQQIHENTTSQSFSKQERKKYRHLVGKGAGFIQQQNLGSNSSQAENLKHINKVSSLASLPQRATSIPDQAILGKDLQNQYDDEQELKKLSLKHKKKTVQSLGKLNTKSALRRLDARHANQLHFQNNASNDDGDRSGGVGILHLEFSEASAENLSIKRQHAGLRWNINNSRLNVYRGSNRSNASPLAGNIYFPDKLRTTLNQHIQPIQNINYRRNYKQDRALNIESRHSLQASQNKLLQKKVVKVGETNLTFFNGSLKRRSQQSEPLDLDFTFLESYYDKQDKKTIEKAQNLNETAGGFIDLNKKMGTSGSLVHQHPVPELKYVKKRTQQMDKNTDMDHQS